MVKVHSFYLKTCCEVRLKQLISHPVCVSYKVWQLGRRTDGGDSFHLGKKRIFNLENSTQFICQTEFNVAVGSGRPNSVRTVSQKALHGIRVPRAESRKKEARQKVQSEQALSHGCWTVSELLGPRSFSATASDFAEQYGFSFVSVLTQFGHFGAIWVSLDRMGFQV